MFLTCHTVMSESERRQVLQELVKQYTASFPSFTPTASAGRYGGDSNKVVVLLSGSTGVFGSNVLAKLATSPYVKHAYAVSRPSTDGTTVHERHVKAFRREGISEALLEDRKVRLLEGDFSMEGFGMDPGMFAKVSLIIDSE